MDYCIDIQTVGADLSVDSDSLSPITGRIIGIGVHDGVATHILVDEDEKALLTQFWKLLSAPSFRLIGFNIKKFDIHFLLVRSLVHEVQTVPLSTKHVLDLREHLTFFQSYMKKGTLVDYASIVGLTISHSYEVIPTYWSQKRFDLLKHMLLENVMATYALFERCKKLRIL
ncbi:MAG TPA: hypothetical protein VK158_00570 [Acidobacteriota bacterium]|nr:hypothetical protein [Acidobacteriota bacterium]